MGACAASDTRVKVFDTGCRPLRVVNRIFPVLDALAVLFHVVAAQSRLFVHRDDDVAVDMQVSLR